MMDYTKEYGIVLEAGGTRGAYQIGALKAIMEKGIKVKGIVGTSIGAINGALFAQGDLDKATDLWNNITCSKIMTDENGVIESIVNFNYKQMNIANLIDRTIKIAKDKGIDITPFKDLLNQSIDEVTIRKSQIDYGLVTISLTDKKPYELFIRDMEQGQLVNYILASAYLPIFKREKINGKRYIDGAFHNRVPIQMLIDDGYKDIIVLKIQGIGVKRRVNTKGVRIIEISPQELLGKTLEFSPMKVKRNLDLGYFDTFKALNDIGGQRYYILRSKTEGYFMKRLLNVKEGTLKKMRWHILFKQMPRKRLLLGLILPLFTGQLNLPRCWSYEDTAIAIIERMATEMELNRFKIYDYDEIVTIIKENLEAYRIKIDYKKSSKKLEHILSEIVEEL
jgi:NTE family protein